MTTPAEIARWLSLLPPSKQGEVKVRHHRDMPHSKLYHISSNHELGPMMPSVTRRTLEAEDRAVPRISTSTSLAGCILAYQACTHDFESPDYKGWYVYGLPFEHAVRPSKKLLPDVDVSDEHWLVTFCPESIAYIPRPVAKFFITDVAKTRKLRQMMVRYNGYIDVHSAEGLCVAEGKILPPGKYAFCWHKDEMRTHQDADAFVFTPISAAEYKTVRRDSVSLLGIEDFPRPGSAYW